MSPEQTALATAARRKSERAHARARHALRELDERGDAISFQAVARHAHVSRQWLYQQSELRKEIERLRERSVGDQPRVPDADRATSASLHERNNMLLSENRRLRSQVAELADELAIAYGRRRAEQ